uniref:Uncharacterized protein n=1 Tax=Anguilla anguilla TaxID=7936 RepID=A0A0E9WLE7_ANGAN
MSLSYITHENVFIITHNISTLPRVYINRRSFHSQWKKLFDTA